jgi:hypothetical protein
MSFEHPACALLSPFHPPVAFAPQGRDLAYVPASAELLVVGSSPELYRLNLEEGRFMNPLTSRSNAINACGGSVPPVVGFRTLKLSLYAGQAGKYEHNQCMRCVSCVHCWRGQYLTVTVA